MSILHIHVLHGQIDLGDTTVRQFILVLLHIRGRRIITNLFKCLDFYCGMLNFEIQDHFASQKKIISPPIFGLYMCDICYGLLRLMLCSANLHLTVYTMKRCHELYHPYA